MKRTCIIVFYFAIFYFKPLYVFVFWSLFYFEYVMFLNYSWKLWVERFNYHNISLNDFNPSQCSLIEIWIEICRINAFSRLYLLLSKKKMSISNLFLCFLIILFGIPLKMLKISYILFKNNKNFVDSLTDLYYDLYYINVNKKIEVLNNEIYLNCFTLSKLLIDSKMNNASQKIMLNYLLNLKDYCKKYDAIDRKRSEIIYFTMSRLQTKEGWWVSPHPSFVIGDDVLNATSKKPFLEESQIALPSILGLTNFDAKDPATILSKDFKRIDVIGYKIGIKRADFDGALFDAIESGLFKMNRCLYTREKDICLQEIMFKYTGKSDKESKLLRGVLRGGHYNEIFLNSNISDFEEVINKVSHIIDE